MLSIRGAVIFATAISLYQNFACLCWDTGDFKFLFMQSFSPHVSWDTGDFKFLFMQSFSPHVSWNTGDFKSLFMQSFSPHVSWDSGEFKFLFMQSFSPHVSWDTGDFKFPFMQSIYPYLMLLTSAKLNGLRMNQTLATMIAILYTITSSVQLAAVAS